jgi:hypothetical protein
MVTGWQRHLGDATAVETRDDARTERGTPGHMRQRGILRLQNRLVIAAIGDLEDESFARGRL